MIDLKLSSTEKEGLKENLIELAMVRKLQIMISAYLKRDPKFFLEGANVPGKARAYNLPISQEKFEKNLRNGEVTAVVCRNLCELACDILRQNRIKAEVITCDTDIFRHADLLITAKDGKQYIVNILEDLDLIQAFMKTPNFASQGYYDIRYKKFEKNNGITTNGVRIGNIAFITPDELLEIDENLGYTENGQYLNDILEKDIKEKIKDFRTLLAQQEFLKIESIIEEEMEGYPEKEVEERKNAIRKLIKDSIEELSETAILQEKLKWILTYCNDRMNIKGHADFVMYYSQSLLKNLLEPEEYRQLTRYDGFTYLENMPEKNYISETLDFENPDYDGKLRFSVIQCGNKYFVISTKPDSFVELNEEQIKTIKDFAIIKKTNPPSELAINLSYKGHALPLVFHPIGGQLINKKQESLKLEGLTEEERERIIKQVAETIITTDEPITSITIPYEGGEQYIYLDKNMNFVVRENEKEKIYHYNVKTDTYTIEERPASMPGEQNLNER